MPYAAITAVGAGLPSRAVKNSDLPAHLETSDEWIRERTGITQRYLAGDGETTSSLATMAAEAALKNAGLAASQIDLIIICTSTPDKTMPSTACLVQARIGASGAAAFDLNAACSGFVYGLHLAKNLIENGAHRHILLIGAETMSKIVDWNDRRTCVLFGDGAGAAIISASEAPGILASQIESDGTQQQLLITNGGTGTTQQAGVLSMQGREVFRFAVDKMAGGMEALLSSLSLSGDALRWVIPHQANARIIQTIARKSGLSEDRFLITLDQHANTSAASIPLALAHASTNELLKAGDILALPALGAGLTWGCCIIRWQ